MSLSPETVEILNEKLEVLRQVDRAFHQVIENDRADARDRYTEQFSAMTVDEIIRTGLFKQNGEKKADLVDRAAKLHANREIAENLKASEYGEVDRSRENMRIIERGFAAVNAYGPARDAVAARFVDADYIDSFTIEAATGLASIQIIARLWKQVLSAIANGVDPKEAVAHVRKQASGHHPSTSSGIGHRAFGDNETAGVMEFLRETANGSVSLL